MMNFAERFIRYKAELIRAHLSKDRIINSLRNLTTRAYVYGEITSAEYIQYDEEIDALSSILD